MLSVHCADVDVVNAVVTSALSKLRRRGDIQRFVETVMDAKRGGVQRPLMFSL